MIHSGAEWLDGMREWREPSSLGCVLGNSRFCGGASFAAHSHPEFVIAVNEIGSGRFELGGVSYTPQPGELVLFNPGEIHAGASVGADWSYRAFYPNRSQLARVLGLSEGDTRLVFREPLLRAPEVSRRLAKVHRDLAAAEGLEAEIALLGALSTVCRRGMKGLLSLDEEIPTGGARHHPGVLRTRDLLLERFREAISLAELSREAGLSRAHFLRLFKSAFGLPPHQLQMSLRIQRAKEILRVSNAGLSEVAASLGFSDQSHFTNCFRKRTGVTPGRFRDYSQ